MTRAEVRKALDKAGYTEKVTLLRRNIYGREQTIRMYDWFFVMTEKGKPDKSIVPYVCLGYAEDGSVIKVREETKEEIDELRRIFGRCV